MSPVEWARAGLGAGVAALVTALLVRLSERAGIGDGPRPELPRKTQRRPVPAVGGLAVLAGLGAAGFALERPGSSVLWAGWLPSSGWCLAAGGALLLGGLCDDLVRLRPVRKALAQLTALAPLALGSLLEHGAGPALGLLVLGFTILNVLNTFDNADGALTGLALLGFAPVAPPVALACAGFLPFNLDAGRRGRRASAAPSAYLGDAGVQVLGFLWLLEPRALGLALLPALDLARLTLERWRAGSRPWVGDRRHLAHRLERRGLSRVRVALRLWGASAPAAWLVPLALARGAPALALLGALGSGVSFVALLRSAPAERPCPQATVPVPCPPPARPE